MYLALLPRVQKGLWYKASHLSVWVPPNALASLLSPNTCRVIGNSKLSVGVMQPSCQKKLLFFLQTTDSYN